MKVQLGLLTVLVLPSCAAALDEEANPLGKVIDLLNVLRSKIQADGVQEEKAYKEYAAWCSASSAQKTFEVNSAKDDKSSYLAAIAKSASDVQQADADIATASSELAADGAKQKGAAKIRLKEKTDFEATLKELTDAETMLGKAITTISAASKAPTSLLQVSSGTDSETVSGTESETAMGQAANIIHGLDAVVRAAALSSENVEELKALVQVQHGDASDTTVHALMNDLHAQADGGTPPPTIDMTASTSIISVLQNMKDEVSSKLADLRDSEANSQHNYNLIEAATKARIASSEKDLKQAKSDKATATAEKASAKGKLDITKKELAGAKSSLAKIQKSCIQKAADHEVTVQGRKDELATIAKAQALIESKDTTGALSDVGYAFLQVSSDTSNAQKARYASGFQAVQLLHDLAKQESSDEIAQLASKASVVFRFGTMGGQNPFKKVIKMVKALIDKLQKEKTVEMDEKAYCDRELGISKLKKKDLKDQVGTTKTEIDKATAESTKLKSQVKELQAELAELAKLQVQMDKAREDANKAFLQAKKNLESGLSAIRTALQILTDYYNAGSKSMLQTSATASTSDGDSETVSLLQTRETTDMSDGDSETEDTGDSDSEEDQQPTAPKKFAKSKGAGSGIINMLSVIESDFAKNLAQDQTEENSAEDEYNKQTTNNKVTSAAKETDVKLMTQSYKALDKSISDLKQDFSSSSAELKAVKEYFAKVKARCIAKPSTYQERRKKRKQELEGLEKALKIINSGAASFLQMDSASFLQTGSASFLQRRPQ